MRSGSEQIRSLARGAAESSSSCCAEGKQTRRCVGRYSYGTREKRASSDMKPDFVFFFNGKVRGRVGVDERYLSLLTTWL